MHFLQTKAQTPGLHTVMLALIGIAPFLLILRFWWWSNRLLNILVLLTVLSLALADRIDLLKAETADSERRLKQFLEAMPIGVAVYDAAAKLNFINQQARRLLNMADVTSMPDESAPTLDQEIIRLSPYVAGSQQPYPPERMPVTQALHGQAATVDDMEIRGSEQRTQLEVWSSPIFDAHQELQYAIAAFQDISERKQYGNGTAPTPRPSGRAGGRPGRRVG